MNGFTMQDEEWAGVFGDSYTKRNFMYVDELNKAYINRYGISRRELNREFLDETLSPDRRILEVGCNVGTQLIQLLELGFKNLYGIDINDCSLRMGRGRDTRLNLLQGNVYNIPFKDDFFDIVMTNGLLIHIPPDYIGKAIDEICRVTKEYIFGLEYYSDDYENITYRDRHNLLWKANYPMLFHKHYHRRMQVVRSRILEYRDGSGNQDILYLIRKLGGGD